MEKSTHTPEYAALTAELQAARIEAGLSQRQLAARLDVPHTWIAKAESGERRVDVIEFCWILLECKAKPEVVCQRIARRVLSENGFDCFPGRVL